MAILSFQKPDKVVMLEADDFRGTFEFRPLEPATAQPSATLCVASFSLRSKAMLSHLSRLMASTMSSPRSPEWWRT